MSSDSSQNSSVQQIEQSNPINTQNQASKSMKDCYKQCFTKYINGSINSVNKKNPKGNFSAPIELSSDDNSDQLSEQYSQQKKKSIKKAAISSSNSSSNSSSSLSSQKPVRKIQQNRNKEVRNQTLQSNKRKHQKIIKEQKAINSYGSSHNNTNYSPSQTVLLKKKKLRLQTTLDFIYIPPSFNKLSTSRANFTNTYIDPIAQKRQICESKRFLNRRLAKQGKIDLGVYSLQQVVTFAYNQDLINKLLYYEFSMNYNDTKQSEFVNLFVNEQIEKWDFKNNKIVLADHRRLTNLLVHVKPLVYKLSNPQSLDSHVSEFLKGIYDLEEGKYFRMMDYIDKLSNNIWWLPIKIKHFTSDLLDHSKLVNHTLMNQINGKATVQGNSNQIQEKDNQLKIKRLQPSSTSKFVSFSIEDDQSREEDNKKQLFKSYVQKITKPPKLIRKYQINQKERLKKSLIEKNDIKHQKHIKKYFLNSDQGQPPSVKKQFQLKSILKSK